MCICPDVQLSYRGYFMLNYFESRTNLFSRFIRFRESCPIGSWFDTISNEMISNILYTVMITKFKRGDHKSSAQVLYSFIKVWAHLKVTTIRAHVTIYPSDVTTILGDMNTNPLVLKPCIWWRLWRDYGLVDVTITFLERPKMPFGAFRSHSQNKNEVPQIIQIRYTDGSWAQTCFGGQNI